MKGVEARKNVFALLIQQLNHQTHRRGGQATTLLSQDGVENGVSKLPTLIENLDWLLVRKAAVLDNFPYKPDFLLQRPASFSQCS